MSDELTPAASSAPEEETKKRTLPTALEWSNARLEYEMGDVTMVKLAGKLGVSVSAVSQHFTDHGVTKGSKIAEIKKAAEDAAKAEAVSKLSPFILKKKERQERTKEAGIQAGEFIYQQAMKVATDAARAGKSPTYFDEVKTLDKLQNLINKNIQERYRILEIDSEIDERELPSIRIENLTTEDLANLNTSPDDYEGLAPGDDDEIVELE